MAHYTCFRNKAVAILGGAEGIGKSCAFLYAQQQADIYLADINEEKSMKLCREIKERGGRITYVKTDATKPEQVRRFAEIAGDSTDLYAVIHCTGGFTGYTPTIHLTDEEWDKVIRLNMHSIFYSSREFAKRMMYSRKGSFVNVSSIAARTALKNTPIHYSCAKAAVESMTKVLAAELGPYGIRVNAVAPGTTKTDRAIAVRGEEVMDLWGKEIPRGTLASPEEIAQAIVFLTSEEAIHITGVCLDVNGGQLIV
ncbi:MULTISPECIES: SDR family NAD(P)-dependent oxidoreductase [Paenibacillus]|uniref:Short-chain dehydrogenase n=1 Tax=Paenibacillus naphthalenovorans TaxID=162209 RepID=A0A0U2ULJ0_9BACL|nr:MULTISPECIES: SDR family NAD(P)-dependent oxidoreductase [Paenibacillus]ALS23964.1 short-chain dehydrogenase [Paenibacillus naphthalenovorans]SDI92729.1 3-oxoacyl-[acyl-carrier protein] reductase/meso-butanediol dehydrogenase / (S,S)-butanediol dehydrogenase / diacetyl reductase [Paenibacillus naphthalenovorans]